MSGTPSMRLLNHWHFKIIKIKITGPEGNSFVFPGVSMFPGRRKLWRLPSTHIWFSAIDFLSKICFLALIKHASSSSCRILGDIVCRPLHKH